MRVLFCGDRNWTDEDMIEAAMRLLPRDTIIIEGEARGADSLARKVAERLGYKVLPFPADWKEYGRAAGPIRNRQMLYEGRPDMVFAFHDDIDSSRGTKNMVSIAVATRVTVKVFRHG